MTDGQTRTAESIDADEMRHNKSAALIRARHKLAECIALISRFMNEQDTAPCSDTWNRGGRRDRHDVIVAHLQPHGRSTVYELARALGFTPDEVRLLAATNSDLVWFNASDCQDYVRMFADARTADEKEGDTESPNRTDASPAVREEGERSCVFKKCEFHPEWVAERE